MKALVLTIKAAALLLGAFAVFWFGYIWIADYGDAVASGTYQALADGQETTLVLRPDHTFHQTRVSSGVPVHGDGTWRRIGEGGLVFSGAVLVLPHQRLMPNGDAYATLNKLRAFGPRSLLSTPQRPHQFTGRTSSDIHIEARLVCLWPAKSGYRQLRHKVWQKRTMLRS
jgi:hypothetical protein